MTPASPSPVHAPVPVPGGWRGAVTLIELITSVGIALLLTLLATTAFIQVRNQLTRMHARLEMHNSARFLYQQMADEFSALQQDGAMWVETTRDDGSGDGTLTLTFLMGKTDEHDATTASGNIVSESWGTGANFGEQRGASKTRCTDLTWSAWRWDQKRAILYCGSCSPPRQFKITTSWPGPLGDYKNIWMANMPQPLRSATPYPSALPSGSSLAALSGNRYGSADAFNDMSDYQDLVNQLSPAIRNVTGCTLEMICSDGSVVDATVGQTQTIGMDGSFVDAHAVDGNGNYPFKKRPRLIRLLVDMTDPQTQVKQTFSFSFQPPGMLPQVYPAGSPIP